MSAVSFLRSLAAALAAVLLAAGSAVAAPDPLLAAAEKEGSVVWYATMNSKDLDDTVAAFSKRYPKVAVRTLRIGSTQLPARLITEQRAGTFNADVVSGDGFQVSQLVATGAFAPYRVPEGAKFLPFTTDPRGFWACLYLNTTVLAWNPERLRADGLKPPESLADLARPEWRGKIGIDGGALNWYLGTVLSVKSADDLLRRIAANKPVITSGHTLTVTQLETGEFDVAPTVYGYLADAERAAGKPIDFRNPKPLLVTLNPAGLAKNAPHPNAARLLLNWLFSRDGQQYIAQEGGGEVSARTDVRSNPRVWDPKRPYLVVPAPDPARYNDAVAAFKAIFGLAT